MRKIVSVNPFRCRVWELHDRIDSHVTEDTCRAEIESFLKHGQLIPAIGRAITGDPDHDFELVCGARRLFVARHLSKALLLDLRELSDQDAIVAMDMENRQRVDISPYERALSYARWIRGGYFQSQDDIARALKVSPSQVSRLLKLTKLPSVVLNAFRSPLEIREEWGLYLAEALEDPARRTGTINKARALSKLDPRPSPRDVFHQLLVASGHGHRPKHAVHDEVIKGNSGTPLFRIRHQQSNIALLLPVQNVSAESLHQIRLAIASILEAPPREHLRDRNADISLQQPVQ